MRSIVEPADSAAERSSSSMSASTRSKSPDESGLNVERGDARRLQPELDLQRDLAVESANSRSSRGSESFLRPKSTSRRPIGSRRG